MNLQFVWCAPGWSRCTLLYATVCLYTIMSINVRENQSDNPETLATLGLQCIGRRQAKEKNHTTQKTKSMNITDPTEKPEVNTSARDD